MLITGSLSAGAEQIVAMLDLKFIEDTGETASLVCDGVDDCYVYATHYLFDAKVDKVISGDLPDKRFRVQYGTHALRKKNFRNVVALLKKQESGGQGQEEAQYVIEQWGEKLKLYCFEADFDDESDEKSDEESKDAGLENVVNPNDRRALNCYE